VAAPDAREVPPEWVRWRDELARIRPAVYRLVIDWAVVQPDRDAPPSFDVPNAGCMRDKPPCAPYAGVRDQLRALASRQREAAAGDDAARDDADAGGGGADDPVRRDDVAGDEVTAGRWQALVVFTSTPQWAAGPPDGCRRGAGLGAPRAIAAYRQLVRGLLEVAAQEGAELRWFSPWNEPNHPYFLSPQRTRCDAAAPSRAVAPYARLAAALQAEVGPQRVVLGETAGILQPTPQATAVPELIRALPRDLVCAAPVWSQHAYIGGSDPVRTVERALAARDCPRGHAIWITETGVGPAPEGLSLARGITSERQGCRLLHRRLRQWYADPRVTLAAQYSFREDDRFPTGLATTDLARARPALQEWQAWGSRPDPEAPPPPPTC
jgi:hypothetical protein